MTVIESTLVMLLFHRLHEIDCLKNGPVREKDFSKDHVLLTSVRDLRTCDKLQSVTYYHNFQGTIGPVSIIVAIYLCKNVSYLIY